MRATRTVTRTAAAVAGLLLVAAACESSGEPEAEHTARDPVDGQREDTTVTIETLGQGDGAGVQDAGTDVGQDPAFGQAPDVARAEDLWRDMRGYADTWRSFPGMDGWQEGESPHGEWLQLYVNAAALAEPDGLADGTIIAKENHSARDDATLQSITVMKKIEGYAPAHGNWFWAAFTPQGAIVVNEHGVPLAGRIGAGADEGCIACHASAGGDDYVFANDGE